MLQKQLKAAGVDPDAALLSLSDIKANLQTATAALISGDETAQPEFDKWERIMSSHPEHIAQLEKADMEWETTQAPLNKAALTRLRSLFPPDLTRCPKDELVSKCGTSLATRITRKAALRMLTMDSTFISKMHAADLICKYAFNGLDVRETRALYAAMPPLGFQNDGDGRKAEWGYRLREKLKGMTKKEKAGALRDEELIAREYPDTTAKPKKSRRSSTSLGLGSKNEQRGGFKGRRSSIASMLEGKVGPGLKKGIAKGIKKGSGAKKKKAGSALAALFAGGGRKRNPFDSEEEKTGSGKQQDPSKILNRKRFSAGKENAVAWRATSSASKQKRAKGKQVMKLASAFKQAQSALHQMMTNNKNKNKNTTNTNENTSTKTMIVFPDTAAEAPLKATATSPTETTATNTVTNTVTMSTVAKSRQVVNELEQLLDSRRPTNAKRTLLMGKTEQDVQTNQPCCNGVYLPWYLIVFLLIFAAIGASIVTVGFWINGSTVATVESHSRSSSRRSNGYIKQRRRRGATPNRDKVTQATPNEHAFTFDASQALPTQSDDPPTNLFPVTSNKKGQCSGNGMNAGCVYTATTTTTNKDKTATESPEPSAPRAPPKTRPIDPKNRKTSKYRAWQLKKRTEEEATKRKATEGEREEEVEQINAVSE